MHDDPTAAEPEAPRHVAQIPSSDKRFPSWTLAVYSEWLVLSPTAPPQAPSQAAAYPPPPAGYGGAAPGGPAEPPQFVYSRKDLGATITLHQGTLTSKVLEFHTPLGKMTSLLPEETLAYVKEWIGPYTQSDLATELRKRVTYFLPLALFFVMSSFACPSPRATQIAGVPVEPVTLGLAGLLVLIYLLGRYYPRRFVFLLDAIWWCVFSADIAYDVHLGHGSSISYIFAALGLWFMYGEVRAYFQFAPTTSPSSPSG